ncbi:hypothetical protein PHET_05331 [Paragonimus heterotremus]|uniref:RRM domain-containing protein n=1 Tax=Paragonimus heterotremus TaxID=100268 RepID=A0A8J4TKX8_9TREM|nr:hypothetical protein PHET_05331 [Paragonimus heterotremus]
MPLTDVNQVTASLNTLQLKEVTNFTSGPTQHAATPSRQSKQIAMNSSAGVLGRQGNQNAAALPPEEGIGKPRECTKYPIIQENGQRRFGPLRSWRSDPPPRGCEVFIGKIPRDCFEDELIPVFERIGPIYMFRLMMEFEGGNRGYGFCVYTNREDTKRAVQELDNYEIRKGKTIGVCFSVDNCRLFVGGIPKNKTREEILTEMKRVTEGVKDVISYPSVADKTKNRGFAFVEYESHKAAAMARRKLIPGRIQLWNQQIAVDWAEPEREVNEDIMSKVKILYARNLMLSTTEESLREHFVRVAGGDPNAIERVKKISDYAFIHFREREQAAKCLKALNDTFLDGSKIEVTWAKPVDKSEISARQQTSQTSSKLMNDFALGKDLRTNNSLLFDLRTNSMALAAATGGLLPQLDPNLPFLFSPVAQTQPMTSDILSINPSAAGAPGALLNIASPSGPRLVGLRNGRRNAAGSRSAGVQRDRKHPVEKLQQRQLNPLSYFEILEEQSRCAGWGIPSFTVLPAEFVDNISGSKFQLYIGQVILPNLRLQFQTPRYYATPEEAKIGACETAILHLQYNQPISPDDVCNATAPKESPAPTFLNVNEGVLSGPSLTPPPTVSLPILSLSTSQSTNLINNASNIISTSNSSSVGAVPTNVNPSTLHECTINMAASSALASARRDAQGALTVMGTSMSTLVTSASGSSLSTLRPFSLQNTQGVESFSTSSHDTNSQEGADLPTITNGNVNSSKSCVITYAQRQPLAALPNYGPSTHVIYPPLPVPNLAQCAAYPVPPVLSNNAAQLTSSHIKLSGEHQLATLSAAAFAACPAFPANYALTLGSSILPSGAAFLPMTLPPFGQTNNPSLGLLQTQTNNLPMSGTPNQACAQTTVGLNSSADCAGALNLNGFEYMPPFMSSSIGAAGLIAPYSNLPTYLIDPNGMTNTNTAAMMLGSSGSLTGLHSVVNMPQATVSCSGDLAPNTAMGQSATLSTAHIPHTGLYNLGLQAPTFQTPPSQLATGSSNPNSLLGVLMQQPQLSQQATSTQSFVNSSSSLQGPQTLAIQTPQTCLSV